MAGTSCWIAQRVGDCLYLKSSQRILHQAHSQVVCECQVSVPPQPLRVLQGNHHAAMRLEEGSRLVTQQLGLGDLWRGSQDPTFLVEARRWQQEQDQGRQAKSEVQEIL